MTTNTDPRLQELLALATAENLTLPMDPVRILALEDAGHALDLVTGDIIWAVEEVRVAATMAAQQLALALPTKPR